MARKILIHAGLHKTATTTAQQTLLHNARLLEPHIELHSRRETLSLGDAALGLAEARNKPAKATLYEAAYYYFKSLQTGDPRPVVFSDENFVGHYIGRPNIFRYGATHVILEQIKEAWMAVMGPAAPFEVYISTRRTGWIEACYWERVKRTRFTQDLQVFQEKFADAADHNAVLERVRERLGPACVHTCEMEQMQHPALSLLEVLGMADLFENFDIPDNKNMRLPQDVSSQLLALNQSDLSFKDMQRAKKALLLAKDPDWAGLW